jgi:tetratricopeptide (TPR) repeat protein
MKKQKEGRGNPGVVKNPLTAAKNAGPEGRKTDHGRQLSGKKKKSAMANDPYAERWKYYVPLTIILLLTFFIYLPALHNGLLTWDDDDYIKNNTLLSSFNLKEIFSQYVLCNYHPFTILALALEYHLFGLNETGYHAVNLLLHLLNVILVFYAVFLLSDKAGVALIASLLFGIHPMHVESVAWIAELKDLLYTFFFLLSYIFYLKYIKYRHKKFLVFALLLFLASLLSKAMAASLPVVLILTDYFKGRKINLMSLLEKIPFFFLAIIFGLVAVSAQRSGGSTGVIDFTFPQRILFACFGFISYLYKLLLPLHLSAFYPYPVKSGESIPLQYYAYLVLFAGLIVSVLISLRYTKTIFFGIGFFALTVFLVLQLFPVGGAVIADRYSYIPSIGIFFLAGEGYYLMERKKLKMIRIIVLGLFTLFFSILTYSRCGTWKDDLTLWTDVISRDQTIEFAYTNRGIALRSEHRNDEAVSDFSRAIELKPDNALAYNNRGVIYYNEKRNDKAVNDLNKAIELKPDYAEAYNNRGNVFYDAKKYDEAIRDYSKAIKLHPGDAGAYFNRAHAEFDSGKENDAITDLKRSASLGFQPAADVLRQINK